MTVISVRQDEQVFVLNEDNEFVCAHTEAYVENYKDPSEARYVCDQCDMYAPAIIDGYDEEGRYEYKTPEMWEWQ